MREIYGFSEKVYVWLGEIDKEEHDIFHTVIGLAHCVGLAPEVWKKHLIYLFDHSHGEFETLMRGFGDLLGRPWFSRIWVIQEAALAVRDPILLAGGAWCYLFSFFKLFTFLTTNLEWDTANYWPKMLEQLTWLNSIRYKYQKERGVSTLDLSRIGTRLDNVLGSTHGHFEATIPHDHVYGVLGLIFSGEIPTSLQPDYNIPYGQVFQEYARCIMENTGNLSILIREESGLHGVPSWVPDFRMENSF
jgi:hypothetical protein